MGEGTFHFFIDLFFIMLLLAVAVGCWALLLGVILGGLSECFGIDLLARWRKRK